MFIARDARADKGQGEGQSLTISCDLVSRLHSCAYASDSTATKALRTTQALPLSEASMSRQQNSGMCCKGSCELHTVLLSKLEATVDSCLVLPQTSTIEMYRFLWQHSSQVKAVIPALSCCDVGVAFT